MNSRGNVAAPAKLLDYYKPDLQVIIAPPIFELGFEL